MNEICNDTPGRTAAHATCESTSTNGPGNLRLTGEHKRSSGFMRWLLNNLPPIFIALPMGIFGVQHFIYLDFVAHFIPPWIPWRVFWACFTGVALIAAATGIIFKLCNRWAATLLGTMIFLWVVMLHTSRIAAQPTAFAEWRGIFQALAMSGCAFALAGTLGSLRSRQLAPWVIGLAIAALGIEHFIFTTVTTPQVPVWILGPAIVNYLTGAALLACGIGICIPRTQQTSAVTLAALVFLSMLFFHLPVALRSSRFESDWTKTFVLSGGAILLARLATSPATAQRANPPLYSTGYIDGLK